MCVHFFFLYKLNLLYLGLIQQPFKQMKYTF